MAAMSEAQRLANENRQLRDQVERLKKSLAETERERDNADAVCVRWYQELTQAQERLAASGIVLLESESLAEDGIARLAAQRDQARDMSRRWKLLAKRMARALKALCAEQAAHRKTLFRLTPERA